MSDALTFACNRVLVVIFCVLVIVVLYSMRSGAEGLFRYISHDFTQVNFNFDVTVKMSVVNGGLKVCGLVFEATCHIIKLYHHRRCKNKKPNGKCDTDYTQRNARTRFLYYARVSGRKVPFATSGWPDTKDRKGNGHQKY